MSDDIFTSLVAERGGEGRFSISELAICRHLSQLLADPSASPHSISALIGLLPVPATAEAPPYDLGKLTRREFQLLEHLLARASGETKALPPKSRSELQCQRLGDVLTRLEDGGCAAFAAPRGSGRVPTLHERIEVRSTIDSLLFFVGIDAAVLWAAPKRSVREEAVGVPSDKTPAQGLSEGVADPTVPLDENVTPIRPRSIHDHPGAPLATHNEPWRGHVGGGGAGFRRFDHPGF
jgi:hypothetical protein